MKVIKRSIKKLLSPRLLYLWRVYFSRQDMRAAMDFLRDKDLNLSFGEKLRLLAQLNHISVQVECPHRQSEILMMMRFILHLPKDQPGVIVEAGCFRGGSTAKLSLAAKLANRTLVVFDSFQGLPPTDEVHTKNIFGGNAGIKPGDYAATMEEVKANLRRFGSLESCRLISGWFEDTMPRFYEPVAMMFLDIDLVSSTRTSLKYLYPLLVPGGMVVDHDTDRPLIVGLLENQDFWQDEVGFPKPEIPDLGKRKVIRFFKPQ